MSLILYSSETKTARKLMDLMKSSFPLKRMDVCRTTDALCIKLRKCFDGSTVVVLIAGSRQELHDLLSFQLLLSDLRVVLVLPDRHRDTVRKAHGLRPRFFTYADGNLDDVAAVIGKMLHKYAALDS